MNYWTHKARALPGLVAASVCGLCAFVILPVFAQNESGGLQDDLTYVIEGAVRPVHRLAVPEADMAGLTGPALAAGRELMQVLRTDLESSGIFRLQGPEQLSVLRLTGDQERDFELYRSMGNELILENTLREEPGRLVLEGRLFQLSGGESILGKRYRGGFELTRRIAHTFSDEIVRYFTGKAGVAMTAIAFHSDRAGGVNREIYLMDYDGWNQRAITAHETLSMFPSWSPQGDSISYMSYLGGSPGIYVADVRSGRKTPLVTHGTFNTSPAFSPDGSKVAFARSVGGGNTEIFVCDGDGSNLLRLTHARGIDTNPAWSPTGREIAFTSDRAGRPQIYVMGAEGTDLRRATFSGDYNDGAEWSPDGRRLAHSSRRRGGRSFDLALTDLVTNETQNLTEGQPGSHESPSFSPDGRMVAYAATTTSRQGSAIQIWIVDLHQARRRQVTREGNNWAPDWSSYLN